MELFKPQHINASSDDLQGNHGLGRYIFLSGSDERAREISNHFQDMKVRRHPRHHNLYLGKIVDGENTLDVAAIATGMGGSSSDIIINELILLGARRLLRIGTAGSLQPETVKVGDVVIATAAVRDDKASWDYIYREYPAAASLEYLLAIKKAVQKKTVLPVHFGIVHSKSSLFARELDQSFMEDQNRQYMKSLHEAGVLASEMECAQLFILSSLMSARLRSQAVKSFTILAGCILAVVGDKTSFSEDKQQIKNIITEAVLLGIETNKQLAAADRLTVV